MGADDDRLRGKGLQRVANSVQRLAVADRSLRRDPRSASSSVASVRRLWAPSIESSTSEIQ